MAKTMNCEFCGKEIKKGFLGLTGDAEMLFVGNLTPVTCCPACHAKYKDFAEKDDQRFGQKVDNMKANHRKISKEERAKLFEQYYEEAEAYSKPDTKLNEVLRYHVETEKGSGMAIFHTKETNCAYETHDELIKKLEKDGILKVDKNGFLDDLSELIENLLGGDDEEPIEIDNTPWAFTGEDITRFEYLAGMYKSVITGVLKKKTYLEIPVTLHVNDPHQMTYKPCAFQGMVVIPSGFTGNAKAFKQAMEQILKQMKEELGVNNEIQAVCHKSSLL